VKVVISNAVVLNTGDAAILAGVMETLKRAFGADIQFVIYEAQPTEAARYYPDLDFRAAGWSRLESVWQQRARRVSWRLYRLSQALAEARLLTGAWLHGKGLPRLGNLLLSRQEALAMEEYRNADLVAATGGTYLVEHYDLRARILDLRLTLLLNRRLALFTQSMGPFSDGFNRRKLKWILSRAALVLLRDEASLANVRDLGVHGEHVRVTADAVFVLSPPAGITRGEARNRKRVAISVREWEHFKTRANEAGTAAYQEGVRKLVAHLVWKHEAEVVFLSTCQGVEEYWTDDSRAATAIAAKLPAEVQASVTVDSSFHRPHELLHLLSAFDLIIATRMHMAILGMVAGTPVIPIAYEFKTKELFRSIGFPELVHDIETVTPESLIGQADRILGDAEGFRRSFGDAAAAQRLRAMSAPDLLKQVVQEESTGRRLIQSRT
jgi:colanic acid/amylovoran biosynthesis protein